MRWSIVGSSYFFVMDLKRLLSNAQEKRFKADCVVKEVEAIICQMAKEKAFKKYEFHKIIRNGMDFELLGVTSDFYSSGYENEKVSIGLVFTVCSKLPKEKREKVEEFKEDFKKHGYFIWCQLKTPLWEELEYRVEVDAVLYDTICLEVE